MVYHAQKVFISSKCYNIKESQHNLFGHKVASKYLWSRTQYWQSQKGGTQINTCVFISGMTVLIHIVWDIQATVTKSLRDAIFLQSPSPHYGLYWASPVEWIPLWSRSSTETPLQRSFFLTSDSLPGPQRVNEGHTVTHPGLIQQRKERRNQNYSSSHRAQVGSASQSWGFSCKHTKQSKTSLLLPVCSYTGKVYTP